MEFPSKIIETGVNELSRLAGIGQKTGLRLALDILRGSETDAEALGNCLIGMRRDIQYLDTCGNISEAPAWKSASSTVATMRSLAWWKIWQTHRHRKNRGLTRALTCAQRGHHPM